MDTVTQWIKQITSLFHGESSPGALTTGLHALAVIVGAWIVWIITKHILTAVEGRLKSKELIRIHDQLFRIIRKALFYLIAFIAGMRLAKLLNLPFLGIGLSAVLIVLLATPVKDITLILIGYLQRQVADKTDTQIDNIIFDLLDKFSGAIIYSTAVILALDMLGINVMPFIAGAGVAGIAIGFAAKDTLSNLIAGVLLIIDRPFEIGDRIEVWSAPSGSATWGDVIDIGLRATKIKTTDNIVIIIPNNEIMKRDIVNYTIGEAKIRLRINIGIAYDANTKKAKQAILSVAEAVPWVSKHPAPKVVVRNFGESSVDLQLRIWIDDARKRMNTISHVTDRVKEVFDAEGIEIPYPRRDITIINKPSKLV